MLSLLFATFEWIKYEVTKKVKIIGKIVLLESYQRKQKVTTCYGS